MRDIQMESNQMKASFKTLIVLLFVSMLFLNSSSLFGFRVTFQERIEFSPDHSPPPPPWDYCVTEDELFIMPDSSGDVRIYERNGKYLKHVNTIRKDSLQGEFAEPTYCFYNKENGKYGFFDFKKRKVYIFNRVGKLDFKLAHTIRCSRAGTDFKFREGLLFISGFKSDLDGSPNDLYYTDVLTNRPTLLMTSQKKYALSSKAEYKNKYPKLKNIGIASYFDFHKNNVYFAWEGDLRIHKTDIDSGRTSFFGKKTPNYSKPTVTAAMKDALKARDIGKIENLKSKFSYVKNLYCGHDFLMAVYEGPYNKDTGLLNIWLQFYDLRGEKERFINEVPITVEGNPILCKTWFDNERNLLYVTSGAPGTTSDYSFLIYQVSKK